MNSKSQKFLIVALFGAVVAPRVADASVTLVNSDRREYEISVKCKADAEPMDDIIEVNGLIELDAGPCLVKLKGGGAATGNDGEILEIRDGKIGLQ